MTIKFNCPNCDALIAFDGKHSGEYARCTNCNQLLIIPAKDNQIPKKIKPEPEKPEPIPGFYHAVFIDTWKLFFNPKNATGLIFVTAAVCFKFFTGHVDYSFTITGRAGNETAIQLPLGSVVSVAAWGCLFWYYIELIHSTSFDTDDLPEVDIGGLFGFIWNIIKSLFMFFITLAIVLLPCAFFILISRKFGVECPILKYALAIAGLFAFPVAIATYSVGRDITMLFRPDYLIPPIVRAFWPYLIPFALFFLAWTLQLHTIGFSQLLGKDKLVVALHLLANLAVQALAIITMRSIGLFYRHYNCYFPW